jgi:hypothetical protein
MGEVQFGGARLLTSWLVRITAGPGQAAAPPKAAKCALPVNERRFPFPRLFPNLFIFRNAHAIERAINKDQRDQEEERANARF